MSKYIKFGAWLIIALLFVATLMVGRPIDPATAAPHPVPTPVSVARAVNQPTLATLMNNQVVTTDTRGGCVASSNHEKADIQYEIDHGTTNTVTIRLQFTNETPGQAATSYINGVAVVTANAADATDMQQLQLFGAWTCVYADVTNSNPLTITAKVLLK